MKRKSSSGEERSLHYAMRHRYAVERQGRAAPVGMTRAKKKEKSKEPAGRRRYGMAAASLVAAWSF